MVIGLELLKSLILAKISVYSLILTLNSIIFPRKRVIVLEKNKRSIFKISWMTCLILLMKVHFYLLKYQKTAKSKKKERPGLMCGIDVKLLEHEKGTE